MKPIIKVENLSKQYRLGANQSPQMTFRETLVAAAKSPLAKFKKTEAQKEAQSFWALDDVNFEIYPGEVVGIIGRNGAGKSTLLKVLSRITEPTKGKIELYGRVGSLLEVGTGFHPELTGRENIFLNGAILGMRQSEIARKFDEIVDFAEVEKFIDTPVKHYSSGMYTRLAFAVAANLEPEILIVDEVLAVGDAEFQKKCLGKMSEVAEGGRTVLFVSHSMSAISTLTKKCLFLADGQTQYFGETYEAIQKYSSRRKSDNQIYLAEPKIEVPNLTRVEIFTSEPDNIHIHGNPLKIEFEVNVPQESNGLGLSVHILDNLSKSVVATWMYPSVKRLFEGSGRHTIVCSIPKLKLYMGSYSLLVGLADERGPTIFEHISDICSFEVEMYGLTSGHPLGWIRDVCVYVEECEWRTLD